MEAARQAVEDSGFDSLDDETLNRIGGIIGSTLGGINEIS